MEQTHTKSDEVLPVCMHKQNICASTSSKHTHAHTHEHAHTHSRTHAHTHMNMHTHTHMNTHTHMHTLYYISDSVIFFPSRDDEPASIREMLTGLNMFVHRF